MNVNNNKYDIHEWIIRIIKSCKTSKQLRGCEKLSGKYWKIYKDSYLSNIIEGEINNKHSNLIDKM